jgi:predicted TIM-barrel fold metal-dependent hydrolase
MANVENSSIPLEDYTPVSKLVTPHTRVMAPRFPVVDAHNHLGPEFGGWLNRPLSNLLSALDEGHVRAYVDLDGGWGEDILNSHLEKFKNAAPERFRVFGGVDWSQWQARGDQFGEWAAGRIRAQAARGADGVKIWKPLGLRVKDHHQNLVTVDDPRLNPIWQTAGELRLPVTIHIADPVAFFEPQDHYNERWEELRQHTDWHFQSPPYPSFLSIVNAMAHVIERFPDTTFIGAHVGCYAENLAWVGALLDRCPNFNIDISARIGELGRQPYTARKFFLKYAAQILFGTDAGPNLEMYRIHYRFLETEDEYFNYAPGDIPPQGRWFVNGLYLPDEVLKKIYYQNAVRILHLDPRLFD